MEPALDSSRDAHRCFMVSFRYRNRSLLSWRLVVDFLIADGRIALHESRVKALAQRMGPFLARTHEVENAALYQLVEAENRMTIYPGGSLEGAALADLEDGLGFPWE